MGKNCLLDVLHRTREKLNTAYPKLKIAGYQHGYFSDDSLVVKSINKVKPDILFVGMGSPRQEQWISGYLCRLNVSLCLCVGGSFDVVAGVTKLAPEYFRRSGFEFIYRLVKDPRRIKRQLVFPHFLASLLATRTGLTRKYGR